MTKWEYAIIPLNMDKDDEELPDQHGDKGWDLCQLLKLDLK